MYVSSTRCLSLREFAHAPQHRSATLPFEELAELIDTVKKVQVAQEAESAVLKALMARIPAESSNKVSGHGAINNSSATTSNSAVISANEDDFVALVRRERRSQTMPGDHGGGLMTQMAGRFQKRLQWFRRRNRVGV